MKKINALLSAAMLLLFTSQAFATTYTVKNGDNLYRISKKFKVSSAVIKEANGMTSDKLSKGMKLTIPDADEEKKSKVAKKENPPEKTADKDPDVAKSREVFIKKPSQGNNETAYHSVKNGDTLRKIAKKYSLSEKELREMNSLGSSRLKIGQQLVVRKSEPKTYTVKKGDNIYRVAKKFNMTAENLKDINEMTDNAIKPGQKLLLAKKTDQEENNDTVRPVKVSYDKRINPVIASTRLLEVKELSASEDLSQLSVRERIMLFAKKMLHLPYKFGGTGSIGLDCSAYVQKVYSLAGFTIPRSAREQFQVGDLVDKKELSIGDLVFFRTYASFPSHVGIYLGNNLFIHASSLSKKITIDSLEAPYYFRRFIGAKRIAQPEDQETEEDPSEG